MPDEIFFEITRIGTMLKCAAIDPKTNIEVFVVGPLTASQRDLQTLATKKLQRKLAEKRG